MIDINKLADIDIDKLTIEEREELANLVYELRERERVYPILDYKLQDYQMEFQEAVMARNPDGTPKNKFIIFIGGNGTGKTQTCAYLTSLIAMWEDTKNWGLPYIGKAPIVSVVTSTGTQIMKNIEPYLLWTETAEDDIKFPWYFKNVNGHRWDVVKKVRKDKEILKEITLTNGTTIYFGSYDQGAKRLEGSSPDLTWIDEIPTRWSDFRELIRGTRKKNAQFIMSFTPTAYNKKIYDWVFWGQDNKFVRQVDAFENKYADHSWMEGLSEDELRIVRFGDFTPPSWLVYKNFNRRESVIEGVKTRELGAGTRFYWALDFWVKHPMAFLFIAVDTDWHVFVFDEIHKSNLLLKDLVKEVNDKCREHGISLQSIIADSAGARERAELKALGMTTKGAKKRKKEWEMSNRRTGIMKINQLLALGKLYISESCPKLIEEFETHHFKETWVDGSVNKENDDWLDALRYFIFSYTEQNDLVEMRRKRKRAAVKAQKSRRY